MQTFSFVRQYSGEAHFEVLNISEKLTYFRHTLSIEPTDRNMGPLLDGVIPKYQTTFGFAYREDIEDYLQNKTTLQAITQKEITYLSDESLLFLKTNNFGEFLSGYSKSDSNLKPDEIWTKLALGEITVANLYFVDYANYEIFDLDMNPLPVALNFDYIEGRMHNGCYDLKKALEVLKQNKKVVPVHRYRYLSNQDFEAQAVPSYNASIEHTEYLSFKYVFDTEEYRRVLAHKLSAENSKLTGSDKLYAAMLELDVLGLRAAGAAKVTKYFDYVPVKDYREDDECHC